MIVLYKDIRLGSPVSGRIDNRNQLDKPLSGHRGQS